MNQAFKKIKSFTDLNTWKEAHKLILLIYKITKGFPKEEQFCLVNQLRRKDEFRTLAEQTIVINKLLNGLIKKSKTMIHDS